jgi:hypothetical protein
MPQIPDVETHFLPRNLHGGATIRTGRPGGARRGHVDPATSELPNRERLTIEKPEAQPMDQQASHLGRREFLAAAATSGVGMALEPAAAQEGAGRAAEKRGKLRVVLVGTGSRGSTNWGKSLKTDFGDVLEFVGLCDINRKRMATAREYIGVDCPSSWTRSSTR